MPITSAQNRIQTNALGRPRRHTRYITQMLTNAAIDHMGEEHSLLRRDIKMESPAKLILDELHLFMGGFISFQYMNNYEVPKRPSQHGYDLTTLTNMWGIIMDS